MQQNNLKLIRKRLQIQQGVIALSSLALIIFVLVWLVSTAMSGTKHGLKLNIKLPKSKEESSSFVYDTVSKTDSSEADAAAAADTSSKPDAPASTADSSAAESSAADSTLSSAADSSSSGDSSSLADGEAPYDGAAMKDDFSDACFIGDSRTVGLEYNSDKAKATFLASTGLNVSTAFTDTVCTLSNGNLGTVIDGIKERKFNRVFIMFGINEIGWPYPDVFVENYVELIGEVKKAQPTADIYVESVLPVALSAAEQDAVFTNANIDEFNGYVKEAAQKAGVKYLDVNPFFKDGTGNLPDDAAADGIHFTRDLCLKWIDLLAYLVPQKEPMTVPAAPAVTTASSQAAPADSSSEAEAYNDYGYNDNGYTDGGYTDYNADNYGYYDNGGYDYNYGY